MSQKPDGFLLASLPSSGSDWVAECICKADPSLCYAREYFSPTVNIVHAETIEQCLGDTMAMSLPRLVTPCGQRRIESLLDQTWRRESFNFTKENYLPFHLDSFANFFDVVVLLREFHHTFPPHRHRVTQWYEHFYAALYHRLDPFCRSQSVDPLCRAAVGHYLFAREYVEAARHISCPVVWFGDLVKCDTKEIAETVDGSFIKAGRFASNIVATRSARGRPQGQVGYWSKAFQVHDELEKRYGKHR